MVNAGLSLSNSRRRNNVIYVVCKYAGDRAEQCAILVATVYAEEEGRRGPDEGEEGDLRESHARTLGPYRRVHIRQLEKAERADTEERRKKMPDSQDPRTSLLPPAAPGADTPARTSVKCGRDFVRVKCTAKCTTSLSQERPICAPRLLD